MAAIWSNKGTNWELLSPTGFPDEATLHTLVEQAPRMLPLANLVRLPVRLDVQKGRVSVHALLRARAHFNALLAHRKNDDRRAAFELAHMNADQAAKALGFEVYEGRSRLRELANRGLLRQVESPLEHRVEVTLDGAREVETPWPLCRRGPFLVRETCSQCGTR
jgi:hypothetical protein